MQADVMLLYTHRQMLKFVEILKTPVEPIRAEYLPRGSLQYEFGSELLQTPIQLLRISNAEAQVPQEIFPPHLFIDKIHPVRNSSMGNVLSPDRLLRF